MIFIATRVLFHCFLIVISAANMKSYQLVLASSFVVADALVKIMIFGWYWSVFKIIHVTTITWKRDVFEYNQIGIEISKEDALKLCKRDNFSTLTSYSAARTLLEARIIGKINKHNINKEKLQIVFSKCQSENLVRSNSLTGRYFPGNSLCGGQ